MYKLPDLGYSYQALEPFIDAETMKIHHDKHHQGYADKLNKALEGYPELQEKSAEDLLKDLDSIPEKIRKAVQNNGGGYVNHAFFWPLLKKDVEPKGEILRLIQDHFKGFAQFKEEFMFQALSVFGSGWAWLVIDDGQLKVLGTQNQDSPLSLGKKPLLTIDVWEHAYYLKYQNKRASYIEAFFNVINWEQINKNLAEV